MWHAKVYEGIRCYYAAVECGTHSFVHPEPMSPLYRLSAENKAKELAERLNAATEAVIAASGLVPSRR